MKEKLPDLTAYRLDEAITVLEGMKINYFIKKTVSPVNKGYNAGRCSPVRYRVLKQTEIGDNIIELIIASE